MKKTKSRFRKVVFVCENEREGKACCAPEGNRLRESLKNSVREMGLAAEIRVSRSGCLDVCAEGPNVLIMPDNIWFHGVQESDLPKILDDITDKSHRRS